MNDARTPLDASTVAALTFIERNAWWYALPPGVRAYFLMKTRIMNSRIYPFLSILIIAGLALLTYFLKVPIDIVLVILVAGIFLGFLIAWAMNHNHK